MNGKGGHTEFCANSLLFTLATNVLLLLLASPERGRACPRAEIWNLTEAIEAAVTWQQILPAVSLTMLLHLPYACAMHAL